MAPLVIPVVAPDAGIGKPVSFGRGELGGRTLCTEIQEVDNRADTAPLAFSAVVRLRVSEGNAFISPDTLRECNLVCYVDLFHLWNKLGWDQQLGDDSQASHSIPSSVGPSRPVTRSAPPQSNSASNEWSSPPGTAEIAMFLADSALTGNTRCTNTLPGSVFVCATTAEREGEDTAVFSFSDLAIPGVGTFVLRYRVINVFSRAAQGCSIPILAECFSAPMEGPVVQMRFSAADRLKAYL